MALPNIIFITADGLRWDGMGCAGDPDILTPNIDALAAHGVRFTQAIAPYPELAAGNHALLTGGAPPPFAPKTQASIPSTHRFSLVEALRSAGYATAAVGALDLTEQHDIRVFDEVYATGCAGAQDAYGAWLKSKGKPVPPAPSGILEEPAPRLFPLGEAYHPTTWTGNSAVRYCQNAPEPFFLWVSFPRPRPPFDPPAPWNRMYRAGQLRGREIAAGADPGQAREARKLLAAYYGCISQADRQLGRILATLTARGRTRNLFLLSAGAGMPASKTLRVSGEAPPLPDALIRVPLLFAGHLAQRKGAIEPAQVGLGDVAPTVMELLKLDRVPDMGGRSFYRQLIESGIPHRQAIVSVGAGGAACLRTARYKWVTRPDPTEDALFDLQADPQELHNLQGARQSLAIRKMLLGLGQREAQ